MNILYLCDEYPPGRHGGIGTAVQLLAREMVKKGHNVVVAGVYHWGYGGEDSFVDEGVKVFRFRMKLASKQFANTGFITRATTRVLKEAGILQWDIRSTFKKYGHFLESLIKKFAIDIVEMPDYNDYMRFCKSYVPFPKLSVPVLVKLHGSHTYFLKEAGKPVPDYIYRMEHDLLQQVTAVASVSKYTAEKTAIYLNYPKPIKVLYNGIKNIEAPVVQKVPFRAIFSGSLAEKKGIFQLAKAWNIVNEKVPQAQLWIYGKGAIEKTKSLLNENALKTVFFKGHVSVEELMEQLAVANVAVFPSFAEAFALAPMEAMACGTAVIYSTYTSGPELIEDGHDGLLIDPSKIDDIAAQIIYLFENKEKAEELALNGKRKISERYRISTIADNNLEHYKDVAETFKQPSKN